MPVIIKEILIKTTVHKNLNHSVNEEMLVKRIKQQVMDELKESKPVRENTYGKNR